MKILVVGGNFAGATAALEIKRKLKDKVDVTLIDRNENFVYIPSLNLGTYKKKRSKRNYCP
jgi:sulfide:quinone oxidoreductase